MCGITGILELESERPADSRAVGKMLAELVHRGPDDEGVFVDRNVALGHRRLSIIDHSGGKQPMFSEAGAVVTIFNGEIYNHAELRSELAARGHRFRTRSDTEVIVHAYEEYGDDCVSHFRGMFAFAVWDRLRRRLFLARDRLGIKPLYYVTRPDRLAFASEIKSLLALEDIPREIDPEAFDLYLSLRYVPGPRTMFRGILKLPPGHRMVVDDSGLRLSRYWNIQYRTAGSRSAADVEAQFAELLDQSVRLRLAADVPLGVFLSGGLDSSAILATVSRLRQGDPVKTFSIGYSTTDAEADQANELHYARMAAERFESDHHECRITDEDLRDVLPELVWHLDEPMADPSCVPLYFLSRLTRKHATVVLSGEGADEVLAGYPIYSKMLVLDWLYSSVGPALAPLGRMSSNEKIRRYSRWAGLPMESRYLGVSAGMSRDWKARLLGLETRDPGRERAREVFGRYYEDVAGSHPLNRMLYVDAKLWLPDEILLKVDKVTMAHSLELRVPFLDHKLVEFAAGLAPDLKLKRGEGKRILRRVMRGVLPPAILKRPKRGFPLPTSQWLGGPLKDFCHETLLDPNAACASYFDRSALRRLLAFREKGQADLSQEVWTLLVFEFWHRAFMNARTSRPEPVSSVPVGA